MINRIYRLVAPKQFQVNFCNVDLNTPDVIVRPRFLSICAADQRYFQGLRSPEIMSRKLPMALIHECAGVVVHDSSGVYKPGQKVLLVPNQSFAPPGTIRDNYALTSRFRASGYDGFLQEYVTISHDCIVPYDSMDDSIASICELISVAMHAVTSFMQTAHDIRSDIAVFGDGNLGYIVALLVKTMMPETRLHVMGIVDEKLALFSFADEIHHSNRLPEGLRVDHAFECVGGQVSGSVINSIIDIINPQGTVMMLGVSEEPVAINTRMVLELGLTLIGRSRSTANDFIDVRDLLENHPDMQNRLRRIIRSIIPVSTIDDISAAFNYDYSTPYKTVMQWQM